MCCLCPAMYSCFSLQGKGHCLLLCLCSTWHTGFPARNRTLNHYSGPRFSTELMGFQHSPRKIPHPIHRVAYDHLRWDSGGAEVTPLLSKMRCKADCSSSCLPALDHSVGPPGFSRKTLMWALCFTPAKPNNVGISVVLSFLSLNHLYEYFKSHSDMG